MTAQRPLAVAVWGAACGSVTSIAHDGGGATDGNPDSVVTGGQCAGDSDCKLYPAGVGGCCGACIPATDPQPPMVQCLVACSTPIKSCTCVNHQCTGSMTLL